MKRCSLYRVHKVHARTDAQTDGHTHGTTEALLYTHRNALRGDKNAISSVKVTVKDTRLLSSERASLVEYAYQIWSLYLLYFKSYRGG